MTSAFGNSSQHINGFSCELAGIEHPSRRIRGGGVQIYPGVLRFGEVSAQTSHHTFCSYL